ncbi:MAG TPA: hypothetical protein VFE93_15735, partial [Myxococcaceae bacterium]|nr:hypothetical protein [Myxococcaceae bacterium]
ARTERALGLSAAHLPLRADVDPAPGVRRVSEIRAMAVDYGRMGETVERIQPILRQWAGL